jgi:hypothetical protein
MTPVAGEVVGLGVDVEHAASGACSRYLSEAVEPRMSMFPSSRVGAKDYLQPSLGSKGQPPSGQGSE